MAKKCFLCNSDDSVIDFNDETFKNFKYNDVELTNASLDFLGYHYEYNILYIYLYLA